MSYDALVASETGIVGYWPLNELSGTVATDLIAARNGTLAGGITLAQSGAGGSKAMLFNGTSGEITVPSATAFDAVTQFSLECWVKFTTGDNPSPHGVCLLGRFDGPGGGLGYELALDDVNVYRTAGDVSGGTELGFALALGDGAWHHVVMTVDQTNNILYVDGALVDSQSSALTNTSMASTKLMRFAHMDMADDPLAGTAEYYFKGDLNRMALYSVVLSSTQVAAHHTAGVSTSPAQTVYPTSIASAMGFGTAVVSMPAATQYLGVLGWDDPETFGAAVVSHTSSGGTTISPIGIGPSTTFGIPRIFGGVGGPVVGPTPRNYLIDRITGAVYPWPVNHDTEDSIKTLGRRLTRSGLSKKIKLMRHPSHPGPVHLILHGQMIDRSQQQYAQFVTFFNNCDDRTFDYIDASGDSYHVVLVQFDARRKIAAGRADGSYFTYNLEMEVIDVNQGALRGYAV